MKITHPFVFPDLIKQNFDYVQSAGEAQNEANEVRYHHNEQEQCSLKCKNFNVILQDRCLAVLVPKNCPHLFHPND